MLPPPPSLVERIPELSDGAIAYRIAVGSAGTRMPAFAATLTENDRWDLVNFLRDYHVARNVASPVSE
jgi:mono/diheme cytochrome c family protein